MMTPAKPPKAAAKSVALPPGAHGAAIPGSRANDALKGAPRPGKVVIDKSFVSDPRGGQELKIGKKHLEVRDNRTHNPR
jgi:hypothetical protein